MEDALMNATPPVDAEERQTRLMGLLASSQDALSRFGARMMVQSGFIAAVLPCLDAGQCNDIERLFRQHVEDAMSCTDDVAMSVEYHSTMLAETNVLLTALRAVVSGF